MPAETMTGTFGADVLESIGLRSVTTVCDEILSESGTPLDRPLRQVASVAVVENPWVGGGAEQDLGPEAREVAPVLGKILSDQVVSALGGVDDVATFGKAALVGTEGELEHAGALIHTPYFGNIVRELLEGTSVLCFADGRAIPGTDVRIPLWHKTHATSRDHYQTIDVHLTDAPREDEICVVVAASDGPRPFPRLGDRRTDAPITSEILKGKLT